MKKILAQLIGSSLMIIGVFGMLTPIPFGLFFFIAGLMFLVPTTPWVTSGVKGARARIGLFDRVLYAASDRLPYPMRRILRQTETDRY